MRPTLLATFAFHFARIYSLGPATTGDTVYISTYTDPTCSSTPYKIAIEQASLWNISCATIPTGCSQTLDGYTKYTCNQPPSLGALAYYVGIISFKNTSQQASSCNGPEPYLQSYVLSGACTNSQKWTCSSVGGAVTQYDSCDSKCSQCTYATPLTVNQCSTVSDTYQTTICVDLAATLNNGGDDSKSSHNGVENVSTKYMITIMLFSLLLFLFM